MIPRILHQTFRDWNKIPDGLRPIMKTWRDQHPDWVFHFYTDATGRDLIKRAYPWLLETYDACEWGVQRSDIIRVVLLHFHGGWYADLDYECLRSLDCFAKREYVLCELHPGEVGNAIMASEPGWWYWEAFLRAIPAAMERSSRKDHDRFHRILYTTGPGLHADLQEHYQLKVEPWQCFAPVICQDQNALAELAIGPVATHPRAYAKHWWAAGWVDGDIYQPRPHIPSYDSTGQPPAQRSG